MKFRLATLISVLFSALICSAQQDTLKVISYNVLGYGNGCQGADDKMHAYLKTIVQYEKPDLLGLVKMQIQNQFADSVLALAMNTAYPGMYNYCTYTNVSHSNDMDLLLYTQSKLGFVSTTTLATIQEDFDLFKLFYKDPFLSSTHDSTFIYVVLCHTVSGNVPNQRDHQDSATEKALATLFYHLPNLIYMGDFNTHSSGEAGYHFLTNNPDTNFTLSDPPLSPDSVLKAPIDWDLSPTLAAAQLTTTTRASATLPNSCGTGGGGKDWYDHLLLSSWLINDVDYIKYIKGSYRTIGNDGRRVGVSINDSTNVKNISVPLNELNALYQFSDKYPVTVKLAVTYDSSGISPVNPVNSVADFNNIQEYLKVNNPVHNSIRLLTSDIFDGQKITLTWYDVCGRLLLKDESVVYGNSMNRAINFIPGLYLLHIQISGYSVTEKIIVQ